MAGTPPRVSPIRGLIDFHTHAAPDVFGRAVDDDELASLAATREMEAVVFKSRGSGRPPDGLASQVTRALEWRQAEARR